MNSRDKAFFISCLASLWILVLLWPSSLEKKVTPLLTVSTITIMIVLFLHLNQQAGTTKEKEKKLDLGFRGLYYLIIEPIIASLRPTVIITVEDKSFQPFINFLRYVRYLLQPDSFCSCCGKLVKKRWIPVLPYNIDPGVRQSFRPLQPAKILCQVCDPTSPEFFNEEEKRRTSYIV